MAKIQIMDVAPGVAAGTIVGRQRAIIKVRQNWTDAWTLTQHLQAMRCTDASGAGIPMAEFVYRSGVVKWEDSPTFVPRDPVEYRRWFVRIEILEPAVAGQKPAVGPDGLPKGMPVFTGRFVDDERVDLGSQTEGNAKPVSTRDQTLTAFGLALELDRKCVDGAWVTNDNVKAFKIGADLVFNDLRSFGRNFGNRSQSYATEKTRAEDGSEVDGRKMVVFANPNQLATNYEWTVGNILDYLLTWYRPDGFGTAAAAWTVAGQREAINDLVLGRYDPAGKSLWQVCGDLLDRRLGLGFCVRCDDDNPILHVFTTVGETVKLGTAQLAGNNDQAKVELTGHGMEPPSFRVESCTRHDWIEVIGEPILSCFTISFADKTLDKGWTDADQTAYIAAAGDSADINDADRATSRFSHVFTKYILPPAFDWMVGDGGNQDGSVPAPKTNAHPTSSETGRVIFDKDVPLQAPYRNWGHKFESRLPIRKDAELQSGTGFVAQPEYLEPFALIYDEATKAMRPAHKSGPLGEQSGTVRVHDHDQAVFVEFTPNHLLALSVASEFLTGAKTTRVPPVFDWQKMLVTVAVRQDNPLSVIVKVSKTGNRVLVIRVPDAEFWHVAKGTVLGMEQGQIKRQDKHQALRDDSDILRRVAIHAKTWMTTPRAVLSLTSKRINVKFRIGRFITKTIDELQVESEINSPVTHLEYDLVRMTTAMQTNFGELDFIALGRLMAKGR